jgi:hypothetical protein
VTIPVRLQLLGADETAIADTLEFAAGSYYTLAEIDAGAGELVLAPTSPNALDVQGGTLVRVWTGDTPTVHTTQLVERVVDPVVSEPAGSRQIRVKMRDRLALLEDAPTEPWFGIDALPYSPDLRFDYSAPPLDDSDWGTPVSLGRVWTADEGTGGGALAAGAAGKSGLTPEGHTDLDAEWWWDRAVDGIVSHPIGDTYWRKTFTLASDASYQFVWTADDHAELCLDGFAIGQTSAGAVTWTTARNTGKVRLTAGTHVVAIRASNDPYLERTDGSYNPGGVTLTAYRASESSDLLVPSNIAFRLGTSWRVRGYPASPPGFTVTHAARLLIEAAQATGHLTDLTLDFTDDEFTDGSPAVVSSELVARGKDNVLESLRSWSQAGWFDFALAPDSFALQMWPWQGRPGVDRGTLTADQIAEWTVETRR